MKQLGWVYLIGYAIDAVMNWVGLAWKPLEYVSSAISSVMMMTAVVALIFGIIGLLKPRRVFIALAAFYLLLIGYSFVLSGMVAYDAYRRGGRVFGELSSGMFEYTRTHWPALFVVLLVLMALQVGFAAYGLVASWRAGRAAARS